MDEFEEQGVHIVWLVDRLLELLVDIDASHSWQCNYRCRDLSEEVLRLKMYLGQGISLGNWANPLARFETRLETTDDERIDPDNYQARLWDKCEALNRALRRIWELEYRCRDLSAKVCVLEAQLKKSVPMDGIEEHGRKPKTAMEKALEERIEQLEGRGKLLTGQRRRAGSM